MLALAVCAPLLGAQHTMHTLYAQLVRLCTVPPVSNPKDKWANYADVPEVLLALCTPTLAHRGDGAALVRRLPVLVDVSETPTEYDWAHLPLLEAFLQKTGLVKLMPLDPGSLQLHQFFCLVNPALSNSSPASFYRILEVFEWPTDALCRLLLRILVHPLPNTTPGSENWSDTRLATRLIERLGSCVDEWAPMPEDVLTLNSALTPELPDWAEVPATAIAFHTKRLRETAFDGFLAWAAVQNLEIVPMYIANCTKNVQKHSEAANRKMDMDGLVETFQWIFKSGREADVFAELEWHREAHCLKAKARGENCPYNAEHMRGGQLLHQWCRCSGARLIGHVDPMWTLAQAEEPGSVLECALRAVIEALGDDMPRRLTMHVPKCMENHQPSLRPMMQKNVTSPLIHMGRYLPALVEPVLDARATYFRESDEGKADLAEFFSHLLRWTVPREQLLRNQHGGAKAPGKQYEHYTACRAELVTTLLEPPWSLLPPHWNNPLAAGWYQRTHGKDPNVTGAAVSVWDEELADGITAKHVVPMTDEEKLATAKKEGRYVDLDLLGPEQLCVKVKIEGTEGEYETVYNTYEEPEEASVVPAASLADILDQRPHAPWPLPGNYAVVGAPALAPAEAPKDVVEVPPPAATWKQTKRLDLSVHSSKRVPKHSVLLKDPREPGQLQITELVSANGASSSSRLSWTPSSSAPRRGWQADATQVHKIWWINNGEFPWTYQAQLALHRLKGLKYNYVNLGFQGNPVVARSAMIEFVRETKRAGIPTVFSFNALLTQEPDDEDDGVEEEEPPPRQGGSDTESHEEPVVDNEIASFVDEQLINELSDLMEPPVLDPKLTPKAQIGAFIWSIPYPYASQAVATASATRLVEFMRNLSPCHRTPAMTLALNLPIGESKSMHHWVYVMETKRRPHTIKTGIIHALNPQKTANWAMYETGSTGQETRVVAGIALNLRCHPFVKEDVEALMKTLPDRLDHELKKKREQEEKREARLKKAEEKTTDPMAKRLLETLKSQRRAFTAEDVAMQVNAAQAVANQLAAKSVRHDYYDSLNVPLSEWTWSESAKRRVRVVYREPVLCSGFHDGVGTLAECYRPSTDAHGKPVEQPPCTMPDVYYGTLRIIEQEGLVAPSFLWTPHESYKDAPGAPGKAWKSFVSFDSRQVIGMLWPKGAHLSPNRLGTIAFTGNKTSTTKHHVIFCFGAPMGETTTYTSRFTTFVEHLERHYRLAPDRAYTGETQLVNVMNGRRDGTSVARVPDAAPVCEVAAATPAADPAHTEDVHLNIEMPEGCAVGDRVHVTLVNDDGMAKSFCTTIPEGALPKAPICCHFKTRKEMSHKGLRCAKLWKDGTAQPPYSSADAEAIAARARRDAPGKTDAALLAEKLEQQMEHQQQLLEQQKLQKQLMEQQTQLMEQQKLQRMQQELLEEMEKKKRQQAALTAPAPAPPLPPAKRPLVVDNNGAVSAAPEPKRQACGDKKDPIVLE